MLYIIRGGALVKIGYTADNVKRRLTQLQIGSPMPLRLVTVMEGERADEVALHDRCARWRSHGEWFQAAPVLELLGLVKKRPKVRGRAWGPYKHGARWRLLRKDPERPAKPGYVLSTHATEAEAVEARDRFNRAL